MISPGSGPRRPAGRQYQAAMRSPSRLVKRTSKTSTCGVERSGTGSKVGASGSRSASASTAVQNWSKSAGFTVVDG
jgi:hypothetical protein